MSQGLRLPDDFVPRHPISQTAADLEKFHAATHCWCGEYTNDDTTGECSCGQTLCEDHADEPCLKCKAGAA